jgi:hypothetical protein
MDDISSAVKQNLLYICTEVLADSFEVVDQLDNDQGVEIELENELKTWVQVSRK